MDKEKIKKELESCRRGIKLAKLYISDSEYKIKCYEKEIVTLQSRCKHDFETDAVYAGHIVKCKICGLIEGV